MAAWAGVVYSSCLQRAVGAGVVDSLYVSLVVFMLVVVWVFKGRKLTKIPAFSNTELLHSLGSAHKLARI